MNCQKAGQKYLKQTAPIFFLIVVLLCAAWVRFDGITEQGINNGDAFRFMHEAKLWADGQAPQFMGNFYRPVSYFLMGIAVKLFGYNDYSVKILHSFLDMINILLIFLIGAKLAKNRWVGVVGSLLYAFLPNVIRLARWELVHVGSEFFVLLALFFFILFDERKNRNRVTFFLLFLAGLSSGLAANTHSDLAFLAPGYVLVLFIKSYDSQNKKESLIEFIKLAAIFTFSFFTPYGLGFIFLGTKQAFQVFLKEIYLVNHNMGAVFGNISKPNLVIRILSISFKYFFKKQIIPFSTLLVGAIFIKIYRKMKKKSDPLTAYFPLLLIASYVLLYSCFVSQFGIGGGRLFLPFIPMVILIITYWYYKIIEQHFGKYALTVFICLSLALFLVNPKALPGKTKYQSGFRFIYDILENKVNPENKLLIAPVTTYAFDRGYQSEFYFGNNAVYMVQLPIKNEYSPETLEELLKNMNIRYVFLDKRIDYDLFNPDFRGRRRELYDAWLNNDNISYSVEKDLEIIHAYICSKGGLLINKNRFGKIYYLTGDTSVQN